MINGFSYIQNFLQQQEQTKLLEQLKTLEYTHDFFRGQKLKRAYAQFGYTYISIWRRIEQASDIPEFLLDLIQKIISYCPSNTNFNQCIVTHYPLGAGISWHTDAKGFNDCIVAVSIGG